MVTDVEIMVACEFFSQVAWQSPSKKTATSFTFCSTDDVLYISGFGSIISAVTSIMKMSCPVRNYYGQLSAHHKFQAKRCEFLWGFCLVMFSVHASSTELLTHWFLTMTVTKLPENNISNTCQFKMAFTRQVTKMWTFLKYSTVTGIKFHKDCIILTVVLPSCALLMNLRI